MNRNFKQQQPQILASSSGSLPVHPVFGTMHPGQHPQIQFMMQPPFSVSNNNHNFAPPAQSPCFNMAMSPAQMMLANSGQNVYRVESRGDSAMSVSTPHDEPPATGRASMAENIKPPIAEPPNEIAAKTIATTKVEPEPSEGEEDDDDECCGYPFDSDTSDTIEMGDDDDDDDNNDDYVSRSTSSGAKRSLPGASSAGGGGAKKTKISDPLDDILSVPLFFPRFGGFGRRRGFFGGGFRGGKKKEEKKKPRGDGGKQTKKSWAELTKTGRTHRMKGFFQVATNELLKKFTSSDYNERLPEHPVAKVTLKLDFENGTSQQYVAENKKDPSAPASSKPAAQKELFSFF